MVSYKCAICDKSFDHKNDYKKHLNRKKACGDNSTDCSEDESKTGNFFEPVFRCPVCYKTFNRKYNLNRHLYTCCASGVDDNLMSKNGESSLRSPTVALQDVYWISKNYQSYPYRGGQNYSTKNPPNSTKLREKLHQNPPEHSSSSEDTRRQFTVHLYKCNFCLKTFSRSDSLNRHLNDRCVIKEQQENEKERIYQKLIQQMEKQNSEIIKLQEQNNELKSKIGVINPKSLRGVSMKASKISIKNGDNRKIINKTQNNFNTINLVAFGQEDLSNISEQVGKKLISKGFQSVPKFVEFVHFNKNRPENHNVYISNMRDNYAMIFDGRRWRLNDRGEVIDQLVDDKKFYLIEKFDELSDTLDESSIKKFKRFLSKQDDEKVRNNMKKEIKFILYNNKDIPEETRRITNG